MRLLIATFAIFSLTVVADGSDRFRKRGCEACNAAIATVDTQKGKDTAKPEKKPETKPAVVSEACSDGSCSTGACSSSSRRSLFRRR